jgi:two-component system sensor histidine kinase KdpD
MLGMRALGVLAMAESSYSESFYDAIGSLTAVAIERASAVERNSRSEAAREGELLRTALLDSITHELRTPLTGIRLAATTLAEGSALNDDARQDLVTVINEESKRMDALIDEAVTMARIGAGDFSLRKEAHPFAKILAIVLENLRLQLRGRVVTQRVPNDLPEILFDGDLIRRVLKHLIENATQYSPPRSPITITAEYVRDNLHISMMNEGPGIAEDEQAYVFDRFFRGAHGNTHANGTGMGLAIVKAIVEAHQGKISVRSTPGHGATFSFWIPAITEEPLP